jgi:hypothetical protein
VRSKGLCKWEEFGGEKKSPKIVAYTLQGKDNTHMEGKVCEGKNQIVAHIVKNEYDYYTNISAVQTYCVLHGLRCNKRSVILKYVFSKPKIERL